MKTKHTNTAENASSSLNLKGQCLIAMPGMEDSRFARAVIFICSHGEDGAMGFVLNQPVVQPEFVDILEELGMKEEAQQVAAEDIEVPIFRGGPVEQGRGFVLHSLDFSAPTTARIDDIAGLTATLEALRALAGERRPAKSVMLLGYSGWSEGQLEQEIAANGWLTVPATEQLLFDTPTQRQYDAALALMGIDEALLSASAGNA